LAATPYDPYIAGTGGAPDVEGFADVSPLTTSPPLLDLGGGVALGIPLASQDFDVYNSSGTALGSIQGDETVANLLGMTNTEFTVGTVTPVTGETAADLPTKGSVYDVFNLGHGYENVYTATPDVTAADGTVTPGTVTDTLVTPYGNENLTSLFGGFNAANPLNPGDAFTGLATSAGSTKDAFTIDGTTFDPQTVNAAGTAVEGFTPVYQTIGAPPLLDIGGGTPTLFGGTIPLATQSFDIYSGSGSSAVDVGSITSNETVTNLLGTTNTEFTVAANPIAASGDTSAEIADLPTQGTVYDVLNLGNGYENIYTAIPGVGSAHDTVTDTLVTPFGDENLSSLVSGIDAVAALDPGAAFGSGLDVAASTASAVDPLSFLGL